MENIGLLVNYEKSGNFFKDFIFKLRGRIVPVKEYGFNFVVVSNKSNFAKIFRKKKVEFVAGAIENVLPLQDFTAITGDCAFEEFLPGYLRKIIKAQGDDGYVTVVDSLLSQKGINILSKICRICPKIALVTANAEKADTLFDEFMEEYGVVLEIMPADSTVKSNIAVVVNPCNEKYKKNCLVIDKKGERRGNLQNDFYIEFKTRPPKGMPNITFAECIAVIRGKDIDNK